MCITVKLSFISYVPADQQSTTHSQLFIATPYLLLLVEKVCLDSNVYIKKRVPDENRNYIPGLKRTVAFKHANSVESMDKFWNR